MTSHQSHGHTAKHTFGPAARLSSQLRLAFAAGTIFVVSFVSVATGQDLIGLYLTWRQDPTTTITINWVDIYADSSDVVWYRAAESNGKEWSHAEAAQTTMGPTTLPLRRVELTGLQPGTLYEFGISAKSDELAQRWRFRTMPAELTGPLRFAQGGDTMHNREMVDAMNRRMQQLDPDFTFIGGDIAYANDEYGTRWIEWLESWTAHSVGKGNRLIPLVIAIGNHEVKGGYHGRIPDDAEYFYSLFALPEDRSYYALDFGRYLSLIVLDSGHTQPVDGAQAEWLEHALAERTSQQFLFAGYHYPAYGTSKEPPGGLSIDNPRSVIIREHWVPHFERYGVSALFEHDHHTFKRSHRLRNHQRDDENGLLYLGDGAWGVRARDVPDPKVGWWLAKAESRNHLWHVELRPDGTAKLEAIDVEGVVFDTVSLDMPRTKPVHAPAAAAAR